LDRRQLKSRSLLLQGANSEKRCPNCFVCRRIFCSFADEDFPRGHAIRIFKHGFSNRGEKPSRSYPLLLRDTQLGGVTSFRKRISR
jgi:hypothetical protein